VLIVVYRLLLGNKELTNIWYNQQQAIYWSLTLKKLSFLALLTTLLLATPNKPSNLTFTDKRKNSVTLHWVDNSDDEKGFKIYRRETLDDDSSLDLIYITKPNETSYKDTFLYADTNYTYEVNATDFSTLNKEQKRVAEQVISVFENNTTQIQYDYAEDINDSRGVTAGRVGFTTETGDLLELLKRYNNTVIGSKIGSYVHKLRNKEEFEPYEQDAFIDDWKYEVANSKLFIDIQDKLSDEMYYYPAMQRAYDLNLTLPVSLLVMYDTNVQHGMDHETIDNVYIAGLNDIIELTDNKDSEDDWIREFLGNREYILNHTKGWEKTDYRIAELWDILEGNPSLAPFKMYVDKWDYEEFDIK